MRSVIGLGETLLDIIFKENQPISAKPGGSVVNALISLSRMRCHCTLMSEIGHDAVGTIILEFLNKNGIDTRYIFQHDDGATTLALAFLDQKNDASYQFYKNSPEKRFEISRPIFGSGDIFLFGSTLAINKELRQKTFALVNAAHQANCIIVYDPNCRKNHTQDPTTKAFIEENFSKASIVRCSNEDLTNIYGTIPLQEAIAKVKSFCKNIIVTQNSHQVIVDFEFLHKEYLVKQLVPISTVGAGDNFNAGIIYAILEAQLTRSTLGAITNKELDTMAYQGIEFSAEVCLSLDNYLAPRDSSSK